jgi:hypothetical protein
LALAVVLHAMVLTLIVPWKAVFGGDLAGVMLTDLSPAERRS